MGLLDQIQQANMNGGPNFGGPIGSVRPGLGWSRNPNMDDDLLAGIIRANANKMLGRGIGTDNPSIPQEQIFGSSSTINRGNANRFDGSSGGTRFVDSEQGGPTPIKDLLSMHRQIGAQQESRQEDFTNFQNKENVRKDVFALKENEFGLKEKEAANKLSMAEDKIKIAEYKININSLDNAAKRELEEARIEAINARHDLDIKQKQDELKALTEARDAALAENKRLHDMQNHTKKTRVITNPDGSKTTVEDTMGDDVVDDKIEIIKNSDGTKWRIPKSRLSTYLANGYSSGSSTTNTPRAGVTGSITPAGIVPKN